MAEESASVSEPSPVEEYREQKANRSALERVSMLVPNLIEETSVAELAADADVSKETARKYLNHFANWNVLIQTGTNPDTFVRNESYFDWLRVDTLEQENSVDDLQGLLSDLAVEDEQFADELEAESPSAVNMLEGGYDDADEYAKKVREWQGVRDRMNDVVAALRSKLELGSDGPQDRKSAEQLRISE